MGKLSSKPVTPLYLQKEIHVKLPIKLHTIYFSTVRLKIFSIQRDD